MTIQTIPIPAITLDDNMSTTVDLSSTWSGGIDTLSISNSGTFSNSGTVYTTGTKWYDPYVPPSADLAVAGDVTIEGNLKIKGKDIASTLERIEEQLAILVPDAKLEEKWEELRNLRKAYDKLRNEIVEKEKLYEILSR